MTSGIEGFKDSTIERPSTPQILKSSNPHKGMTLIELLAVVMIVGIMSSVLIMRLGPMSIGNPGAKAAESPARTFFVCSDTPGGRKCSKAPQTACTGDRGDM